MDRCVNKSGGRIVATFAFSALLTALLLVSFAGVGYAISSIQITAPNGGEQVSGEYGITWVSDCEEGENVKLYYGLDGTLGSPSTQQAIDNTCEIPCNGGTYNWDTTTKDDSKTSQIRIVSCTDSEIFDYSDNFFELDNTPPQGTISGVSESWVTEDTITIGCSDSGSGCRSTINYYFDEDGSCSDNSQAYVSSTDTGSITVSSSNDDYICIWVEDEAGNSATAVSTQLSVDSDSPTSEITEPEASSWHKDDISLVRKDSDTGGSGISSCDIRILDGGNEKLSWTGVDCNTDYTVDVSEYCITEGTDTCEVQIRSTDGAGTISGTYIDTYSIDTSSPVVGTISITPSHENHISGISDIEAELSDGYNNIASCQYTLDGTDWVTATYSEQTGKCTANDVDTSSATSINIRATDSVGNTGLGTSVSVSPDTTDPETSDDTDDNWHNSDVDITLTPTDSSSGVSSTDYCVDSDDSCSPDTTGLSVTITSEGTNYIRYRSIDNVGNEEEIKSSSYPVKIDKTKPTISVGGEPSDWIVDKGGLTATVTYEDDRSGCDESSVSYLFYDEEPQSCSEVYSDYTDSKKITNHVWVCSAVKDNAGNIGFSQPVEFRIESTIQAAIDDASADDKIIVASGTYKENITIDKKINLTGQKDRSAVIDGGGSDNVVLISGTSGVGISGFTVKNSGDTELNGGGIVIQESSGCYLENNEVFDTYGGIAVMGSNNNHVYSNDVRDNTYGIVIDVDTSDNVIYSINNKIYENTVKLNQMDGIYIGEGCDENEISLNEIHDNSQNGIYFWKSGVHSVNENSIKENGQHGIELMDSQDNSFDLNNITGNLNGIYIRNGDSIVSKGNHIYSSNIYDNTEYGIKVPSSEPEDFVVYAAEESSYNWFGDNDPSDDISSNVIYEPFLYSAYPDETAPVFEPLTTPDSDNIYKDGDTITLDVDINERFATLTGDFSAITSSDTEITATDNDDGTYTFGYTISQGSDDGTKTITIKAVDNVGNEKTTTYDVIIDNTVPNVVTDLKAESYSDGSVHLSWDASSDENSIAHYNIYRNTETGIGDKLTEVETTTYIDQLFDDEDQTYYYTVRAVDVAGNEESNEVEVIATKDTASNIAFTQEVSGVTAGEETTAYTVTLEGSLGTILKAVSDITLNLDSGSTDESLEFRSASGGDEVSSVVISQDEDSADFYYYDKSAGTWTITASKDGLTEDTSELTVNPDSISSYEVSTTTPQTAGVGWTETVTAKDQYGNTVSTDSETVITMSATGDAKFYGSDGYSETTTAYTLSGGMATIYLKDTTAENIELEATDGTISGSSSIITVNPDSISSYEVSTTTPQTAGVGWTETVTAKDQYGNTVSTDSETVITMSATGDAKFYGSDGYSETTTAYTLSGGMATIYLKDTTAENIELEASDGTISGSSSIITVNPDSISEYEVSTTTPQTAGAGWTETVTAKDQYGNTVSTDSETVITMSATGDAKFYGSDGYSETTTTYTLSGGIATIYLKDTNAETLSFTATDNSNGIDVTSETITISPAETAYFTIDDISSAKAGSETSYKVARYDRFDNPVTSEVQSVYLYDTSNSGSSEFRATQGGEPVSTIDIEDGSDSATFYYYNELVETVTITTSDAATSADGETGIDDATDSIEITPADLESFDMTGYPTDIQAGVPFTDDVTITAYDTYGNIKTDYIGTIGFTSTDVIAELPDGYTFTAEDSGEHTFSSGEFTLKDAGTSTITVADGDVTETTDMINVEVGMPDSIELSADSPTTSVGGSEITITATVKDIGGNPVEDGTSVTISAEDLVTFSNLDTTTSETTGGIATFTMTSGLTAGIATLAATSDEATGTVDVIVAPGELAAISVFTEDTAIDADGVSTTEIYAQIQDAFGNDIARANEKISFSLNEGSEGMITAAANTDSNGVATATLTSSDTLETVTVTANKGINIGGTATVGFISPEFDDTITLHNGWNFVSVPKQLANGLNKTSELFADADVVFRYNPENEWVSVNDSERIKPLEGYWVRMSNLDDPRVVELTYADTTGTTPPTKNITVGWNAIGHTNNVMQKAESALMSIDDIYSQVLGWDDETQVYEDAGINGVASGMSQSNADYDMVPGQGYWVFATGEGTLAGLTN